MRRRLRRVVVADVGDVASGDRRIVDYAYQMVVFEDTAGNGPLFFSGQLREHFFEVQVVRDSKQSWVAENEMPLVREFELIEEREYASTGKDQRLTLESFYGNVAQATTTRSATARSAPAAAARRCPPRLCARRPRPCGRARVRRVQTMEETLAP